MAQPKRLTRAESRERTRTLLRQAALEQFSRHGYAGTSAESIAAAAGFSGGAFYSNYSDKQALLIEVMRDLQQAETAEWARVIDGGSDVETILADLAARAESFARREEWLLIKVEMELRAARCEAFRREYAVYRQDLQRVATGVLSKLFGKAGRRVPAEIDLLTDSWLAMSMGAGLFFVSEDRPERRRALRTSVFIPFLRHLLAQAEPLTDREEGRDAAGPSSGPKGDHRQHGHGTF
jgi:AcrR family transcriptional regulator